MIGKTVPAMLIGLVQATNVLLVAQLWFRIPFAGSFLTLYAGLILFLFASVGIGLFASSISATMQQAMTYSFVIVMPFMLLSGLTTPIRNMPVAMQYYTLINPLRYAIDITQRIYLEGAGFAHLLPEMGALCLLAAVTLTACPPGCSAGFLLDSAWSGCPDTAGQGAGRPRTRAGLPRHGLHPEPCRDYPPSAVPGGHSGHAAAG